MKILYKTVVTLVLLTTVIYSNAVNNASKSVVRIIVEMKGGFSTGTAFCVNSDGYYVTNHHVISDAIGGQFKATALDINHKKYLVDILWYSKDKDLAILKIDGLNLPPLKLSSDRYTEGALEVKAIGFPGGADEIDMRNKGTLQTKNFVTPKISSGVVAAPPLKIKLSENAIFETLAIQHSAPVNHGNSGGPLVDNCGHIVGVNEQKALTMLDIHVGLDAQGNMITKASGDTVQGIFYAVSVDEVKTALDAQNISYTESSGACSSENSINQILIIAGIVLLLLFIWLVRKINKNSNRNINPSSSMMMKYISKYMKQENGRDGEKQKERRGKPIVIDHITTTIVLQSKNSKFPKIIIEENTKKTLGRVSSNSIKIDNSFISSKHLKIQFTKGKLYVKDLNSTNGTYIDGKKLTADKYYSLEKGQKLILGSEEVVYEISV